MNPLYRNINGRWLACAKCHWLRCSTCDGVGHWPKSSIVNQELP